jgi:prepilin peptidase CpaA
MNFEVIEQFLPIIFPLAISFAGITDLLTYTISNRTLAVLLAAFGAAVAVLGAPWQMLLGCLAAGFPMLIVGFTMFACGWIGGGDAKLLAAAALWIGFDHLLPFLFWTALLGGALSIVLLAYRSILPPAWLVRQPWAIRLHDRKEGIPYGVAIAGGALIVYPSTFWMTGLAG